MSEMIERITQAIYDAANLYGAVDLGRIDMCDAGTIARAAIQAMREPTEAMLAPIRAHYARSFPDGSELVEGWVQTAIENHHLMIDAALDEKEGGQ